jgi:hypothetical protein
MGSQKPPSMLPRHQPIGSRLIIVRQPVRDLNEFGLVNIQNESPHMNLILIYLYGGNRFISVAEPEPLEPQTSIIHDKSGLPIAKRRQAR